MKHHRREYTAGQPVVGQIERLLSYGLFVTLADGTRAYIRRRELSWSGNLDPRDSWREGEQISARVLKLPAPGQQLELSHRATLPDPWDDFATQHRQGDVVTGTVKNLVSYGAYVELRPGVDGLVPLPELASRKVDKPEAILWVGDVIEAVITYLERDTRKLRLSIRARLSQLKTVVRVVENCDLFPATAGETNSSPAKEAGPVDPPADASPSAEVTPIISERVGRILVVDDYAQVRLPLVEWLQNCGCTVDGAADAATALRKIRETNYGLLFIDFNLPGLDEAALIRQLRSQDISCHIVVMSTVEWLDKHHRQIEAAGAIDVLVKPLNLDEIEHLLIRISQGKVSPAWQKRLHANPVDAPDTFYQLAGEITAGRALAGKLQAGLEQLVAATPAEAGLIFQQHRASKEIAIFAQAGKIKLNKEAMRGLRASPVRDVIVDGEQVLENYMTGVVRERFRKLRDLLPFNACIGVPLQSGAESDYALFLFHCGAGTFNRYHLRDALAAGALLSVAIERQTTEQRLRSMNKLILSGQLAGGFGHEVYNKMSGLEIQLHNLQTDCRKFREADIGPNFATIQRGVGQLLSTFGDLKETVELFQQLMRAEEGQALQLNDVIQGAILLLRPIAHDQRTKLETELSPNLPPVTGTPTQLRQVFLNLMLNAVQQMAAYPGVGRILTIATQLGEMAEERPVKIRFADTGPGIHKQLWEKIFELGFTTRPGGTGQGLYIARSLIESLGGRLVVERSVMAVGTTFLIELPVASSAREENDAPAVTHPAGR